MSPQSYRVVPKQTFMSLSFFFFHLKVMFTSQVQVHKFSPAIPELEVLRQEDCEFQTNLNCRGKTMFMVGRTTLKHGSLLPLHCCVPLSPFHSLLHAAMKIQEDVQQTLHWCHCMVPRRP